MNQPLARTKRNKPLMVLLLPVIVTVFFVGWAMYISGQTKKAKKP